MLKLVLTAKFRKDFKTIKRRGYDTELLEPVIQTILEEKSLTENIKTTTCTEITRAIVNVTFLPTGF